MIYYTLLFLTTLLTFENLTQQSTATATEAELDRYCSNHGTDIALNTDQNNSL